MKNYLRYSFIVLLAFIANVSFGQAYKTLTFPDGNSKKVSAYETTWSVTLDNNTWNITNFNNNNNGWKYVKCGSKNKALVGTIETAFAIDKPISSVVVELGNITAASVNSISLVIASDAKFENVTETVNAKNLAKGDLVLTPTTPSANSYYKLVFDCKKASANGPVQVNKVSYNAEGSKVLKSAGLAFSKNSVSIEQGTDFVAPTFSKETTATVNFSSDNEGVATVNNEGVITLGSELGKATITATSEENDKYSAGTATITIEVYKNNVYKKATTIESGKGYLLVAIRDDKTYYATPISSTQDHGYITTNTLTGNVDEIKIKNTSNKEFVFTTEGAGYSIKDNTGRYLAQSGEYVSFQIVEEPQAWTVEPQDDGTFKIEMNGYYIQFGDGTYTSFGVYNEAKDKAVLPFLYELDTTSSNISGITTNAASVNAPVYNLAGQKVSASYKGVVIKAGKKYIQK